MPATLLVDAETNMGGAAKCMGVTPVLMLMEAARFCEFCELADSCVGVGEVGGLTVGCDEADSGKPCHAPLTPISDTDSER